MLNPISRIANRHANHRQHIVDLWHGFYGALIAMDAKEAQNWLAALSEHVDVTEERAIISVLQALQNDNRGEAQC